jgi:hypothetical protein
MLQLNWILILSLVTSSYTPSDSVMLQTNNILPLSFNKELLLAQSESDSSQNAQSILDDLVTRFEDKDPRSSRGEICPISPFQPLLWNDRPLIAWRYSPPDGIAHTDLQVTLLNFNSRDSVLNQTVAPTDGRLAYTGESLQPGQLYSLGFQLLPSGSDANQVNVIFQVMSPEQRDQIAAQLQALENELTLSNASSEVISLRKAQYFMQQNLRSDALQVLYAIDNPSALVTQAIERIESSLCRPPENMPD